MKSEAPAKPRIAIFKFSSCDGCQLTLLDAEDELFTVLGAIELAYFPGASSNMLKGPYDIGLVEGSITTHHDAERIHHIRRECRMLVTLGACATAGGIQALRNWEELEGVLRAVYATPGYVNALKMSTPIADHVPVDLELHGCPISKKQLLELLSALLAGRQPNLTTDPVCMECKRRATVCVMVAKGIPCLGPVTKAGCGALCPSYSRGCFGCFGPSDSANIGALRDQLIRLGESEANVARLFRTFNAWSWQFRSGADARAQAERR
jgi:coenzyme F420-reducing hydrogenase gamma subunit